MRKKDTSTPDIAVLVIGGMDPSGGAGVLVDCRAVRAAGAHPAAVIALMTVQDGNALLSAKPLSSDIVVQSARLMLFRFPVRAVKVGAIGSAENIEALTHLSFEPGFPPIVLDPVIASTSGGTLLDMDGLDYLRRSLLPRTALITPNLREASILTDIEVSDIESMRAAGRALLDLGAGAVLVKGGHLPLDEAVDIFMDGEGVERIFTAKRLKNDDVRGTGCALASLIAGFMARGAKMAEAVEQAKPMVARAIVSSYRLGQGPPMLGPLQGD